METGIDQRLLGVGGRDEQGSTEGFKAVRLLCVTLEWWVHVFTHLSTPTDWTSPRVTLMSAVDDSG